MCSSDVAVTVTFFCGSTDQIAAIRSVPVGASFGFSLPVTGQNQSCGHLNPKTVKCVFALIWMRKHNTFSSEKACQDQAKWTEPSEPHLQEQEPQEPLWLNFWLDWYLVRNWPWAAECLSHRLLLQLGNPKISKSVLARLFGIPRNRMVAGTRTPYSHIFSIPGESFLGTSAEITFQHRNRRILKFLPKTDKIANDFQFCRNCGNSAEIAGNSAEICRHFFWL